MSFDELRALAKRIDNEMMELPKDRDGVPIRVGDTVWDCISGMQMAVRRLRLTDRWAISTDTGLMPKASAVTHVRPDSFERIADDIETFGNEADINDATVEFLCKIQGRLYELAKKDGQR